MTFVRKLRGKLSWLLVFALAMAVAAPVGACLLAKRLRVVAPHLTEEEVQLYAHGNMHPKMTPYNLLAATPCVNGQADIFSCDKVDLMGHLNLSQIGGGAGNDLWGWTDPVTRRGDRHRRPYQRHGLCGRFRSR